MSTRHLRSLVVMTAVLISVTANHIVLAATPEPPEITTFEQFIKSDRGGALFNFLVAAGYAIAIAGVVYAGVLYLSAFGSEERPSQAKKALIAVITGLAIIVLSRVIVNSITSDTNSIVINGLQ